jgi:hypothetical protein
MTGDEVAARLATVSALRSLCLRLPHIATPAEVERLQRFEALVPEPARATTRDIEALVAGWSRWWREGRRAELAGMARRLDAAVIDADRRLATFATAANASASETNVSRGTGEPSRVRGRLA